MSDLRKVEELLQLNICLYNIDFVEGKPNGEHSRTGIRNFENIKLLRIYNHICYVKNINSLFRTFRCSTCDTFVSKTGNLERHSVTCSKRVKRI